MLFAVKLIPLGCSFAFLTDILSSTCTSILDPYWSNLPTGCTIASWEPHPERARLVSCLKYSGFKIYYEVQMIHLGLLRGIDMLGDMSSVTSDLCEYEKMKKVDARRTFELQIVHHQRHVNNGFIHYKIKL